MPKSLANLQAAVCVYFCTVALTTTVFICTRPAAKWGKANATQVLSTPQTLNAAACLLGCSLPCFRHEQLLPASYIFCAIMANMLLSRLQQQQAGRTRDDPSSLRSHSHGAGSQWMRLAAPALRIRSSEAEAQ